MSSIFACYNLAGLELSNCLVMAPMTRARAEGMHATALMAEYYSQRASAGLIITESTQVAERGRGYLNTPGIHTTEQMAARVRVPGRAHSDAYEGPLRIFINKLSVLVIECQRAALSYSK